MPRFIHTLPPLHLLKQENKPCLKELLLHQYTSNKMQTFQVPGLNMKYGLTWCESAEAVSAMEVVGGDIDVQHQGYRIICTPIVTSHKIMTVGASLCTVAASCICTGTTHLLCEYSFVGLHCLMALSVHSSCPQHNMLHLLFSRRSVFSI